MKMILNFFRFLGRAWRFVFASHGHRRRYYKYPNPYCDDLAEECRPPNMSR